MSMNSISDIKLDLQDAQVNSKSAEALHELTETKNEEQWIAYMNSISYINDNDEYGNK